MMAIIQERDDDSGSDQARRGGGGEKWLDAKYTFWRRSQQDLGVKKETGVKDDSKVFGQN